MLSHISSHHDLRLVVLAALVCAAGSLTTFWIYGHLLAQPKARRRIWLALTGFCAGGGIWAAHFVAMLAHDTRLATSYNALLTAASFAAAIAFATLGIAVTLRPQRLMISLGGAVIGLGVATMHFIGMQALIVPGTLQWNVPLVACSIALGVAFATGAWVAYRKQDGLRALLSGAFLLTLAIGSLYFTAMAALKIIPNAAIIPTHTGESADHVIALAIAGVAIAVLLASYIVALVNGRAMHDSASQTDELVEAAIEGIVIAEDGVIVSINTRALKLCGCKSADLIGKKVIGDLLVASRRLASSPGDGLLEMSLLCADKTTIPVEVVHRRMNRLSHGNEIYAIRDIRARTETARQLAEVNQELRQREQALQQTEQDLRTRNLILDGALSNMSQGLCMYDQDQRVMISNERFATMYGLPAGAIKPGMSLRDIVQKRIDNGIYAGSSPQAYMAERIAAVRKAQDSIHELSNGRIIAVARRPLQEGGWVTTHDDITDQRRMEEQVTLLAHHDALTGLPRRTALRERLDEALSVGDRLDRRIVMVIGIDRFSEINDTLGHAAGDSVLKAVADRLQNSARRSTILGRFGDDSFAVIEAVENPARDAIGLADRVLTAIRKPLKVGEEKLEVTATIGIAVSPTDGRDADTLMKNAALALNRGRIEGRGRHHFFEAGMDRELRARRTLEQDLAEALEKNQFELHYQPIVNLARNAVSGFEALLRWRHPAQGLMSPGVFLPIAEEAGLLPAIGEWTLQQACAEAARWPNGFIVSVNLAVSQFWAADFTRSIINALTTTGLTADRLEIEITEKVIHDNAEGAMKILRSISDLGVLVALDDFGAGFSSLTYMRQFPFHKIKIDRSFITGLSGREDSRVIIRTLARLGTGLGMLTTAEGVETREQLEIVRAEGCAEMQGYYFSAPKTAEQIRELFLATPSEKESAVA
jgi:diguanylate cyclase (GGDEF)-like protein